MQSLCVAVRCCVFVAGSFLSDVCYFVVCLLLPIGVDCWCRYWLLIVVCAAYVVIDCCMLLFIVWCLVLFDV